MLAEVARRILCISTSSAQLEFWRETSAVSRTMTDDRSRTSLKTVEAMELIRWAVRGSLLNMDDYLIYLHFTIDPGTVVVRRRRRR